MKDTPRRTGGYKPGGIRTQTRTTSHPGLLHCSLETLSRCLVISPLSALYLDISEQQKNFPPSFLSCVQDDVVNSWLCSAGFGCVEERAGGAEREFCGAFPGRADGGSCSGAAPCSGACPGAEPARLAALGTAASGPLGASSGVPARLVGSAGVAGLCGQSCALGPGLAPSLRASGPLEWLRNRGARGLVIWGLRGRVEAGRGALERLGSAPAAYARLLRGCTQVTRR